MRILKMTWLMVGVAVALAAGCKSTHEEGVKSNMHSQWSLVAADTKATTAAAQAVLMEEGLRDVKSSSTGVDGTASGKKADGTEIKVSIKRQTDTSSELTVNVGTMGEPTLGANIAKKIKMKAEMK